MSSIEYINTLAARGIQLWAQDGKLQYKAPREAITPQLIAELKEHKAVLVTLLEQFAGSAGSYPLSYSQKSLWSLHQLNPDSAAYNVTYAARLDDDLDLPALARCVDYLIARHPILRTRYAVVDGQPQQQVATEASARLTVENVFGAGAAAVHEWIDNQANKPFDLAASPIRLKLLVNAADEPSAPRHVLLLNVHHIAADFRSLEIIVRELRDLYRLARAGQPLKLAPLALHYKDCVQHEIDRLQGPEGQALAAFWERELQGGLPTLALATDRQRPPVKTENGKVHAHAFGEPTSRALREAAKALQVTPYMLLLAVYQLFLLLHTGQRRLLIGAPTSGRGVPGSENVLGHFVNAVPLVCEPDPGESFAALVARTRSMMLRVMDHQGYPFPLLVEKLRPPRDPSRSPVFQVMYNWNQVRGEAGASSDVPALIRETLAASSTGTSGATHDLTLNIQDDGRDYVAAWTFNTDLFDETTVARFAAQYLGLLHQVLVDPSLMLASYRMTAPAARIEMLERIARAGRSADARSALPARFAAIASAHPARPAWRLGERVLRYADVAAAVAQLRARLVEQGVGSASVVAIQAAGAAERAAAVLALLELGASACLVDDTTIEADAVVRGSGTRPDAWDPETIVVTPGAGPSQRAPATSAAQIGRFVEGVAQTMALGESSRPLLLDGTEPHLAAALLLATVAGGGTASCPDTVSLAALADDDGARAQAAAAALGAAIVRHEANALALPALLLPRVGDSGLESLQAVVGYGEHPHAVEQAVLADRKPASLHFVPAWSLAAWTGPLVLRPTDRGWQVLPAPTPYPVPIVVGPFEDLADEHQAGRLHLLTGREHPLAGAGCEDVRGPADLGHALVHHRRIETPLEATRRDGEIVCADPAARFAAHRFAPFAIGAVERAIAAQPGVREVVCLVQQAAEGASFTAYVTTTDDDGDFEIELRRRLKQALPEQMHPDAIVRLACLPLAADGSLDPARLPLPQPRRAAARAASNEVELKLAALWCEVLSLPGVGVDDDFFALGGDSILAAVIVSRAGAEGLYIKPKDLFEHTTIAGLAQVVASAPQIQAEQGAVGGSVVAAPAAAWFFEQIDLDRSHFNQALLVALREAPDAALMQETMRLVAQQHDVLRSRFVQRDGRWHQVFDDAAAAADWAVVPCTGADGLVDAALRQQAIDAAQSGLDIEHGPLWRLRWLTGATVEDSRLLIVVHHLLIDGVSWSLLLQDIADVYGRLRSHAAAKLPLKTSSAKAWVEQWLARAAGGAMAEESAHWLAFGNRLQRAVQGGSVALLSDRDRQAPAGGAPRSRSIALDESLTTAFRTAAHLAYGTDANDLLLAALHAGIRAWNGSRALLVDVEGHGRDALAESVDLGRTIGWFTSIYPVLIDAPAIDDPARLIKHVKQGLREIPNKGAGFGVLRHLDGGADEATRRALAALPASPLLFTYLGTLDTMAAGSALYAGAIEPAPGIRSARQRRTHRLDLCAYIAEGRLTIECGFDAAIDAEDDIAGLLDHVGQALTTLIRHCCSEDAGGLTPSDLPGLEIDQDDLDALLDEVAALET